MLNVFDVLLSIAVSFTITFLAIPAIVTVASHKNLLDIPDARKVHNYPIPSLGGVGIFAGFGISCLLAIQFQLFSEMQYFLAAALVIFFLGMKDDILVISPIKKFIGQVLAAFLIVYKGGIQIKNMHGFFGLYEIPEFFSLMLTYFTIILIINSFNLIDGVDGLAGSLGLMTTIIFGIYFLQVDLIAYSIFSFSMASALLAFLIFNFQPAKVFMGDTGSMLIGLVNAVLVIKFINVSSTGMISLPINAAPAVGFGILMIPLLDTLRVFGIRIFHRRSPFIPDRNHIHHLMLDKGMSHRAITFTLIVANFCVIAFSFAAASLGSTILIFGMVLFFFSGIAGLYYTRPRHRLFVEHRSTATVKTTRVVPFSTESILEQKN